MDSILTERQKKKYKEKGKEAYTQKIKEIQIKYRKYKGRMIYKENNGNTKKRKKYN